MNRKDMGTQNISSAYNIKNRFLRSINLQRDFNDPDSLSNYFLTDHALECLNRISEGTKEKSTQRAWRITGDYGSGKSNFALFLSHWFSGDKLPSLIKKQTNSQALNKNKKKFFPLLLTGSRESMGISILKTLESNLAKIKNSSKQVSKIRSILKKNSISDSNVINSLNEAHHFICSSGYDGLIFIIDELGKFLEYAALHPEDQDIYLMQKLAEFASGSGKKPLYVIGILHQGFSAYADSLSQASQHEWEKVAGRYDEILFNQPLEQLAYLINSALGVDATKLTVNIRNTYKNWTKFFISNGWYGNTIGLNSVNAISNNICPIHPSVFPVVVDAFRKFGQNERSLFSFLLSNEPFGIQEFSSQQTMNTPYRLHNLYDYLKFNFNHKLHIQSYKSNWHIIESLVDSFMGDDELELLVIKTIGVINLIDSNKFIATPEAVCSALSGLTKASSTLIKNTLEKLCRKKRIIYYRGNSGGYCLWPHTSVNLDIAYQNAQKSIGKIKNVSEYIKENLTPRPIVARRHYIETGNLRAFELQYCSAQELKPIVANLSQEKDAYIIVPLCDTTEEHKKCIDFAKTLTSTTRENLLLAIPKPLNALSGLIKEVKCWKYVEQSTLELNSDSYACEEVKRQQATAMNNLEHRLANFVDVKTFSGQKSLQWLKGGKKQDIKDGRDLLSKLSDYFDSIYNQSPIIKNELINRQNISSAAAGARMRLISGILENPAEYRLGMDAKKTPPEVAIYLSVMQKAGLHTQKDSEWTLQFPPLDSDNCNILPAFNKIDEMLKKVPDSKICVNEFYKNLKASPYGVREGLIPIILATYYALFEQDIAVYEDGTFLSRIREQEFLRLTKSPKSFEFQYCSIEGIRTDIFKKVFNLLNLPSKKKTPSLLDIVKPLCEFVAQLPEYALKTNNLSENAIKVRNAIMEARDPVNLIFTDLPIACGLEKIKPQTSGTICSDYINVLKTSLDELRFCYNLLKSQIKELLLSSFDVNFASSEFTAFRTSISERAQKVLLYVKEAELKAFSFRLFDDNLAETEWLESLGAFVVSKTPERWTDIDVDLFHHKLPILIQRFKNVESIVFLNSEETDLAEIGCKISLTKSSGDELNQVLFYRPEEKKELKSLQKEIASLIAKNPKLGILAASEEIWKNLKKETHE